MKGLKKIFVVLLALVLGSGVFAGCSTGGETILVWTFTDELKKMVEDYYLRDFPDKKVEVQIVPGEVYTSKIDQAFKTGKNTPDIVALDILNARKYLDSGALLSFSADGLGLEAAANEKLFDYTTELMKHTDDKVYGLSWQASPGAFYYRRSMAKEVFGTEDPAEIQEYVKDWDTFIATAETLKKHSGANYSDLRIMSSLNGAMRVYLGQREHAWIEDNTLVIDPLMEDYLDFLRVLESNKYINETAEWQTGWYSDMSGTKAFGYFLPAWGLHFCLKDNAKSADGKSDSTNDWAVVEGPASYVYGGTFLSVYNGTKHKDDIKHLMEYLLFNEAFLQEWAEDTGDLVSNKNVVNKMKEGHSEEFLGGQNQYEIFVDLINKIDISNVTGHEVTIKNLFEGCATQYAMGTNGFLTKEFTLSEFKKLFKNSFQSITVN